MKPREPDWVLRRIVIEYGSLYAYVYMTDGNGKLLEEESFKQPFRMEKRDVLDEVRDCYDQLWDWLNDTINVTPLQDTGDDPPKSGDPED